MAIREIHWSDGRKSTWQVVVEDRDPVTGKRRRRVVTEPTKKAAQRREAAILHARTTGTWVDPSKDTVADYLRRWFRDYSAVNTAPRTHERYVEIIDKHVIPALGGVKLTDLKPAHIVAAEAAWRSTGLSAATLLKHHRLVSQVLQQAVRWQVLAVNPAAAVDAPRAPRREMQILNPEQVTAFRVALRGHQFEAILTTALYTGMRRGELRGLRWSDVDFASGTLRVQQAA